jgi:hypothetical protein
VRWLEGEFRAKATTMTCDEYCKAFLATIDEMDDKLDDKLDD